MTRRPIPFRKRMLRGHPGDITREVRRVIVHGLEHGLIVTSTTDGGHAPTSFHFTKPGRAVDLGNEVPGTPAARARMVAFQRFLLNKFGPGAFLELFGPENSLAVKNGVQFTLPEGSALENLHDTHVHVVPSRLLPLPTRVVKLAKKVKVSGVSLRGVKFIADFEGFVDHAYKPVAEERFWTIGFGHFGPDVHQGQHITRAAALVLLRRDVKAASRAVKAVAPNLNQNQHDAIASAVFNLGAGVLDRGRSLGDALRAGRGVPAALMLYVHGANGQTLEGLVRRRAAEAALFQEK